MIDKFNDLNRKNMMKFIKKKTGKSITSPIRYDANEYNGFNNISSLIFGHNVWESFGSAADESMKAENTSQFSFIKTNMNKLELAETLIQLQKIGSGKDEKDCKKRSDNYTKKYRNTKINNEYKSRIK